jgi:hypothetical protein
MVARERRDARCAWRAIEVAARMAFYAASCWWLGVISVISRGDGV